MPELLLQAKELSFRYPNQDYPSIDKISFDLYKEELVTVVGSSGSGKTTLLNLLGGHLSPSEGEICFEGNTLPDPQDMLVKGFESMELVKQDFQLSPRHSVESVIRQRLRRYNSEYQQERTEELLQLCNLTPIRDSLTMDISGGQKQRVAIARALADDPSLILMDEPYNQLDHPIKTSLKSELKEILSQSGTTALIVTHDPLDALSVSHRIVVLKDGRLITTGLPSTIYNCPNDLYTASLFGHYNVIPVDLLRQWWSIALSGESFGVRPEHVIISEEGHSMTVVESFFLGHHHLVKATKGSLDLYFYSQQGYDKGIEINLSIDRRFLHELKI